MDSPPGPPDRTFPITLGRVVVYSLLLWWLFTVGPRLAGFIWGFLGGLFPERRFDLDGNFLAFLSILGAVVVLVPLRFLMGFHSETPWRALGFRKPELGPLGLWMVAAVAFHVGIQWVSAVFGRPPIDEGFSRLLASSNPVFFFVGVALAAPLFEEVMLRGFLVGALESLSWRPGVIAATSAVAGVLLYRESDPFDATALFVFGMLMAYGRLHTKSVVTAVSMHALTVALAIAQLQWLGGGP